MSSTPPIEWARLRPAFYRPVSFNPSSLRTEIHLRIHSPETTQERSRDMPGNGREWTRGWTKVLPCPARLRKTAHRIHQCELLCHQVGREGQEVRLLIQAIFCSHR